MFGFLERHFSIAVRPPSSAPCLGLVADDGVVATLAAGVPCRWVPRHRSSSGRRRRCPCPRGSPGRGCSRQRRPCRRRGRAARSPPPCRPSWPRPTPRRACRPAVVGGEGDVDRVRRVRRGVQGDDEQARVARLLDRGVHAGGHRRDEDALVAMGDGVLDRVIWPWSSPSCLPEATVSLTFFFVGVLPWRLSAWRRRTGWWSPW